MWESVNPVTHCHFSVLVSLGHCDKQLSGFLLAAVSVLIVFVSVSLTS